MGKSNDKKKTESWFVRFPKEHQIAYWILTGLLTLIGLTIGFSLDFFFPEGVDSLNYRGWHIMGYQFTTFRFDFANFETNYSVLRSYKEPLIIYHDYKTKSYPQLKIVSNSQEINITCVDRETKQKCEKGFPISDYAQLDIDIKIGFPEQNISKIYFKIMQGSNYREKYKTIYINKN